MKIVMKIVGGVLKMAGKAVKLVLVDLIAGIFNKIKSLKK